MTSRLRAGLGAVPACTLLLLAVLLVPRSVEAQELGGWNPEIGSPGLDRHVSVGVDVGKPLVLGPTVGYSFSPRLSAQLGFSALGDFTALSGEMRFNLLRFDVVTPIPFIAGGFTQYYLADGAEETSPITAHVALGAEYMFLNFFGAGAQLGYMEALGGSKNSSVDRYGISDDVSTFFFTLSGRYLF